MTKLLFCVICLSALLERRQDVASSGNDTTSLTDHTLLPV